MQDSTLVLVSTCALALICAGLLGGIVFLALRFTGHTINEFLGGNSIPEALDTIAEVEPSSPRTPRSRTQRAAPQTSNLRAQAQSLDFDAAVAKYRNNPNAPVTPSAQAVPNPFENTAPLAPSGESDSKRRRRRGLEDDEEMDDMLGGMLDGDGGDVLPF